MEMTSLSLSCVYVNYMDTLLVSVGTRDRYCGNMYELEGLISNDRHSGCWYIQIRAKQGNTRCTLEFYRTVYDV
jgi:hypothetical protein